MHICLHTLKKSTYTLLQVKLTERHKNTSTFPKGTPSSQFSVHEKFLCPRKASFYCYTKLSVVPKVLQRYLVQKPSSLSRIPLKAPKVHLAAGFTLRMSSFSFENALVLVFLYFRQYLTASCFQFYIQRGQSVLANYSCPVLFQSMTKVLLDPGNIKRTLLLQSNGHLHTIQVTQEVMPSIYFYGNDNR